MKPLEFLAAKALLQNTDLHQAEELYKMLSRHVNKLLTQRIKTHLIEEFNKYEVLKKYIDLLYYVDLFRLEQKDYLVICFQNGSTIRYRIDKDDYDDGFTLYTSLVLDDMSTQGPFSDFADIFDSCYDTDGYYPEFGRYIVRELM